MPQVCSLSLSPAPLDTKQKFPAAVSMHVDLSKLVMLFSTSNGTHFSRLPLVYMAGSNQRFLRCQFTMSYGVFFQQLLKISWRSLQAPELLTLQNEFLMGEIPGTQPSHVELLGIWKIFLSLNYTRHENSYAAFILRLHLPEINFSHEKLSYNFVMQALKKFFILGILQMSS